MESASSSPSAWTLPAAAAALLCALAVYALTPSAAQRALRSLPTPPSTLPVLGNTLDLMKYQLPRLHDWIAEQCALHGGRSWLLQALGAPPLIVLSSVETFEDVLKTQFEVFDKGERMRLIFEDILGDGIFAVDGDKWRFQRKKLSHLFTLRSFRETITTAIHTYVRVLGDVLEKGTETGAAPLELGDACHRMAFDVFAEVGFGLRKNTLASGAANPFIQAFTAAAEVMEHRFHQPDSLWQLKRFLRIGDEKALTEAVDALNKEVYAIIYENLRRKNDPNHAEHKAHAVRDVVSLFMDELEPEADKAEPGTQKMDIKFLRDVGLSIIGAGKDTTAWTLVWFVIALNRSPHVAVKVREELKEKLPKLFVDHEYVPSMDDVDQLLYLEAAVKETLRLYPVLPLNAKEANRDTTLSDGTFVPKGARVYIPSYALGRMTHVWGPDAAEFKPERWIETDAATGKQRLVQVPATKFVSFHAGPRICLGMRFAVLEMKTALAYVLSKYELTTVKKPEDFTYAIASGLAVKGPVLVNVAKVAKVE